MKWRAIWMLGLAVVLAGASVFLAQSWIEDRTKPVIVKQEPADTSTAIVVASNRLDFGNTLRAEHLRLVKWPKDSVPAGAFTSIEEVIGENEDRVVLRTIEVNEPVLKSKISGFGGRASLSAMLTHDMRAVTIRVNDVNGVAGFVLPGDRTDVLLTRDPTGGASKTAVNLITDVLLQNVKVLGIDQDANESKDVPSVAKAVTLEVTTVQAQKLALASQLGTLTLMLRNTTNAEAERVRTVGTKDLAVSEAIQPQAVAATDKTKTKVVRSKSAKPKDRFSAIRIVRGTDSTNYQVQPDSGTQLPKGAPISLLKPEKWEKSGVGGAASSGPIQLDPAPQPSLGADNHNGAPQIVPDQPLQLLAPGQKAAIFSN